MYKLSDKLQHSFLDFNQPMGLQMNPDNHWIKMGDRIPWDEFEIKYAELFPSDTGNVAKPLRMALGSLIIQTKFQYADRKLVEQITENPYLQYFIGLPGYQFANICLISRHYLKGERKKIKDAEEKKLMNFFVNRKKYLKYTFSDLKAVFEQKSSISGNPKASKDISLGKQVMTFQLDSERYRFLSVYFYDDGKFDTFSLDEEAARDSHYIFIDEKEIRAKLYQKGDEDRYLHEIFARYINEMTIIERVMI